MCYTTISIKAGPRRPRRIHPILPGRDQRVPRRRLGRLARLALVVRLEVVVPWWDGGWRAGDSVVRLHILYVMERLLYVCIAPHAPVT